MLENAAHFGDAFGLILSNMKSPNDAVQLDKLKSEVEQYVAWAMSELARFGNAALDSK